MDFFSDFYYFHIFNLFQLSQRQMENTDGNVWKVHLHTKHVPAERFCDMFCSLHAET